MKKCKTCGENKDFSEFHKKKDSIDGLRKNCKICRAIKAKEDYSINKEYHRQYKKEYRKDNQWKLNNLEAKRRSRKLKATPSWLSDQQWREIRNIYLMASIKANHVDHIVPLQGKSVCGLHVPWNLQILTPEENCRKGNKI